MRQVTKEEFFRALYADPQDIMPSIISSYDPVNGYSSEWRLTRYPLTVFGKSTGGTCFNASRYWLA
jgi:hypothetical protein